ncbi:putative nuclease HARBI1 [Merluccius polli]|uniref:Nuclease HARBI1 n=1 Tax=Merluccius polli TaxID=89951 RepID=A0AA47N535_MERPO|nr:putative nuclease HARBI1 [Merluccius polli]
MSIRPEIKWRQVFESVFFWWATINKNVDWVNYIYYNQQRFVNFTTDAVKGLKEQLDATSRMTYQNRLALDMILTNQGGVCAMFGTACCTFVPNNTAPDGSVSRALAGLQALRLELTENSGITDPFTDWMEDMFGKWRGTIQSVGMEIVGIVGIVAVVVLVIIAVGAIDGCHVRMKPPSLHRLDYLNYKGFYSINMQAICDSTGKFLDIFVGYPGSVHDTRILKKQFLLSGQKISTQWILYPGRWWVSLFGDTSLPHHSVQGTGEWSRPAKIQLPPVKARSIVERAFGIMKTRWRSTLFRALEVSPTFAPQVIASCAFLHNVCIDNGDVLEPDTDVALDILDPEPPLQEVPEGT